MDVNVIHLLRALRYQKPVLTVVGQLRNATRDKRVCSLVELHVPRTDKNGNDRFRHEARACQRENLVIDVGCDILFADTLNRCDHMQRCSLSNSLSNSHCVERKRE